MKMALVIYDAGIDEDLRAVLDEARIDAYTKLIGGTGTGHRFGTPIWPGTKQPVVDGTPRCAGEQAGHAAGSAKKSYLKPPALQVFVFPVEGN